MLLGVANPLAPAAAAVQYFAATNGKQVVETPKWQYGGRAEMSVGSVSVGLQRKLVGSRFATDVNDVKVKGYTFFDLDASEPRRCRKQGHQPSAECAEPVQQALFRKTFDASARVPDLPDGFSCGNNTNAPRFTPATPGTVMSLLSIAL